MGEWKSQHLTAYSWVTLALALLLSVMAWTRGPQRRGRREPRRAQGPRRCSESPSSLDGNQSWTDDSWSRGSDVGATADLSCRRELASEQTCTQSWAESTLGKGDRIKCIIDGEIPL